MIITDKALQFRENIGNPIRVGIIGAGYMSKGLINQIERYTSGMKVVAISNRTIDKALGCYHQAGITDVAIVNNASQLSDAISHEQYAVCQHSSILCEADGVDIIVEATGTIDYAASSVLNAVKHHKPVVLLNAELDATLGPILKYYADQSGVILTGSDGDQPGVIMNLYRFVKGLGFDPLVAGNIKGFLDFHKNPDDMAEYAKKAGQNVNMITSFTDGTKIAFEQASVANATGMVVNKRGMNAFRSTDHVDELTQLYDIDELKSLGGIVDYAVGPKPGPGVYVFATTDDPLSKDYLNYLKLGKGPLYSFYTPYHLCFFEVPNSIVRTFHFNDAVMAPLDGPVVEVVTAAKQNLKAGDTLDGFGGYTSYGVCENYEASRSENLLPIGLTEGVKLKRDVAKDAIITFDDIEILNDQLSFQLYQEQLAHFAPKPVAVG
ncbi:NAD(P)H-dependent oxidoreductase [Tunicatimonas pelagia]|uniref:NAD(P)H-dependent oxidoreductase n=1 Tax=Tunicatimonas pelagia TaxID=931531 RepID=UPI00266618F4|nr:NAD(P)-dependent oxidoreductase [Tunicatimonas pelagia]WKN43559.1 NAD(P)-dependent oxidoreductase [Tunicatimonas pelagia]